MRLPSLAIHSARHEIVLPASAQPDMGAASLRTLSRATLRHCPSPSTNFALSHVVSLFVALSSTKTCTVNP